MLLLDDPILVDRTDAPDVTRRDLAKRRVDRRTCAAAVKAAEATARASQTAVGERDREAARLRSIDGLDDAGRRATLAASLAESDAAARRLAAAARPPVAEVNQEVEDL